MTARQGLTAKRECIETCYEGAAACDCEHTVEKAHRNAACSSCRMQLVSGSRSSARICSLRLEVCIDQGGILLQPAAPRAGSLQAKPLVKAYTCICRLPCWILVASRSALRRRILCACLRTVAATLPYHMPVPAALGAWAYRIVLAWTVSRILTWSCGTAGIAAARADCRAACVWSLIGHRF